MKDRLEDFISKNKTEFDELESRNGTWNNIQSELGNSESKNNYGWVWKLAAMVFLCLSVLLILERNAGDLEEIATNGLSESNEASLELQEVEVYYTSLISQKKNEIKLIISTQELVDIDLLKDLEQLDAMYLDLKSDLEVNENDERLINALILNLQLRVEILNKQLKILEKISKYENNEKISI